MTVTELTDIYKDVTQLLSIGFDYVHWQLNVIWTDRWDVKTWADNNYLPGIRKLVDLFLKKAEEGRYWHSTNTGCTKRIPIQAV